MTASPHLRRLTFQSTPSVWRETCRHRICPAITSRFQSTPSVWRETINCLVPVFIYCDFNPLPPCGGRPPQIAQWNPSPSISIHSLRVEGDFCTEFGLTPSSNFNPLPPCGGRRPLSRHWWTFSYFNPLPPCGGRLAGWSGSGFAGKQFQSTPSVWRETYSCVDSLKSANDISIHSLRVEGDLHPAHKVSFLRISIHSLRVEGDGTQGVLQRIEGLFQSTPSVWRETSCQLHQFFQ